MGTVWKARSDVLARTVALKFLPDELADSPAARRRFLREARAASRLKHDGIATVYEAGEVAGRLFIATEYVNGCTLREGLGTRALPVPEAVRIARAAAGALGHAHDHGVIHRDVSSANIMLGAGGRVTVIDFGLARLSREGTSRLTPSGAMLEPRPTSRPS
jgi:serine/threonine-protein kinase